MAGLLVTMAGAVVLVTGGTASAGGGNGTKTSLCHRTAADSNPYVFVTVDDNALDAHLNNLPGHPAKFWKSAGTWRGVPHQAGDPREDYVATSAADCQDNEQPPVDQSVAAVPYTTTNPTCEADGTLVPAEQPEGVAARQAPAGTGPGSYTITFAAEEGFVLTGPSSQTVTVEPRLTGEQCVAGTETATPQPPHRTPTVLGTEAVRGAPAVPGTAGGVPTAVHAGLAGASPSEPGHLLGGLLVGTGLVLLGGAGGLTVGRSRGEHQG